MTVTSISRSGLVPVSNDGDIQIFYQTDGPLDGTRPIVLLSNSLAASIHLWDGLVAEFSESVSFVRYDSRFHGRSPLSQDPEFDYNAGHSMDELAQDVILLLNHLQINRVQLAVGLSIGAGVVLIAGTNEPQRFEHILVVGTRAQSPPGAGKAFDDRIVFARERGTQALARQSLERWFPASWIENNPTKASDLETMVGDQNLSGYIASVSALRALDLYPAARKSRDKHLGGLFTFIAGEKDDDIPDESKRLAEIAGSRLIIIPNTGHIVNVQSPEVFHNMVRDALSA